MLVLSTLEEGYSPAVILTLWFAWAALAACGWWMLMKKDEG
jgi:hypothetical protein